MFQTDNIEDLARELDIDFGSSSNSADRLRKIAETIGMDHYNSLYDNDKLEDKLKELYSQRNSNIPHYDATGNTQSINKPQNNEKFSQNSLNRRLQNKEPDSLNNNSPFSSSANNVRQNSIKNGNPLNFKKNSNNNGTASRINDANRKSQNNNLTNTLANKGLESVGVPPGISNKIVNSKAGQKAINNVKENVPGLSTLDSLTGRNKPEPGEQGEGFQNFVVPKKVKKITLISMIPTLTFLIFCCLFISASQIFLNAISLGDADSLMDSEVEEKIDKKGDEGLDEEKSDEDVGLDEQQNDDVAYSNITTNNIIFMTKFNESNLLVANYSGRKYNEADIGELEDFYPAVSVNNTNLAYDFFYKMYNLNKYYAELCNKNIIDLPLLMSTLRIQYEDMSDVFKANLDEEDTKSYKRKQPVEEYKYDYDWSKTNYISTSTISTHDMEILVQHMINVEKTGSGFKCTLDSKNYKEFLKEFIENKYYLDGYKPGKPENYTTGNNENTENNDNQNDNNTGDTGSNSNPENSQNSCKNCTEFTSKFITWLLNIANDNSHGYAQDSRVGKPDYDCSSLVYYGLLNNGFNTNQIGGWPFNTRSENEKLTKSGFKRIQFTNIDSLEPGDILLRTGHTEVYVGKNLCVGAHINEKGGISNGQPGDQTGDEISVQNCSKNWLWAYRYKG